MNEKLKSLAEKSGFLLWENETWNQGEVVDWSSNYDKELEVLFHNLIKECIEVIYKEERIPKEFLSNKSALTHELAIKEHFGIL